MVGARVVDHAHSRLGLGHDPAVELVWPQRAQATMHVDSSSTFIIAASPRTVDAIAIEPQTHAPYGLRRLLAGESGGLTLLAPHETLSLVALLEFEQLGE